ncbi:hypothetical protein GOODEAATRI_028888 [Goodea atripinnis]|uniref:Uncharacterized protein n=1 Tax=Goodea atripinnis TaxID=208336 RepID=A0ABV0NP09_9TELE
MEMSDSAGSRSSQNFLLHEPHQHDLVFLTVPRASMMFVCESTACCRVTVHVTPTSCCTWLQVSADLKLRWLLPPPLQVCMSSSDSSHQSAPSEFKTSALNPI